MSSPLVDRMEPHAETIFATMSALALEHDAVNLGQGFPDDEPPASIVEAARRALADLKAHGVPIEEALVILDGFILNYILKGRLRAKFGTVERGIPFYAVMRSVQLRPLRMPKPQVKRRQYPE